MAKHLVGELAGIAQAIEKQADLVHEMVSCSYRGLHERCLGTAGEVLSLEKRLNQREIEVEQECLQVLATQQPVAADMRRIVSTLKINVDLERIGDLALNLAERTEVLVRFPRVQTPEKLEEMFRVAIGMLRNATSALHEGDSELAMQVCASDDPVDHVNSEIIAELAQLIRQNSEDVEGYLQLFSASRIIERIADHATNIAEHVVYIVRGEIKRHAFGQREGQ